MQKYWERTQNTLQASKMYCEIMQYCDGTHKYYKKSQNILCGNEINIMGWCKLIVKEGRSYPQITYNSSPVLALYKYRKTSTSQVQLSSSQLLTLWSFCLFFHTVFCPFSVSRCQTAARRSSDRKVHQGVWWIRPLWHLLDARPPLTTPASRQRPPTALHLRPGRR